jgi:hypothetical protein
MHVGWAPFHQRAVGVGRVSDHDDSSIRQRLGQQDHHIAGKLGGLAEGALVSGTTFLAAIEPHQDRQRPGLVEGVDVDAEHYPNVTPVEERALARRQQRISVHGGGSDFLAGMPTQGIVNRNDQRLGRVQRTETTSRTSTKPTSSVTHRPREKKR